MSRRILFMGSPKFSVPILAALSEKYDVCGVFTQPDRPAGRGRKLTAPPIKELAASLDIPVFQPEKLNNEESFARIKEYAPELIVVAAYGQLLKSNILDLPRFGCINVHASLLPRWRGASPIQAAVYAGDELTGVTIMKMDAGMDTGDMIARGVIQISVAHTAGSLSDELAIIGAELLMETIPDYLAGLLKPEPQPEEGITYASLIRKQDGLLDVYQQTALELERKIRAYQPWPGTFLEWQDKRLKVLQASIVVDEGVIAGQRSVKDGWPVVGTQSGWLQLNQVQPAGKNPITGKQFLNGARDWDANSPACAE